MKKFLKSKFVMTMMMVVFISSMSLSVFADANIANGQYSIEVTSSSAMFKVVDAKLNVVDGEMSAVITLSGTGYSKLYMGTEEEAIGGTGEAIHFVVDENGKYTYLIPVSQLDSEINVAAFSTKSETWYGRILTFNSNTMAVIEETKVEEEIIEEVKEEVVKIEEPTKEVEVKEVAKENTDNVAVVEATQEEAIPKTGDHNTVIISGILFVGCFIILVKNKKVVKEY